MLPSACPRPSPTSSPPTASSPFPIQVATLPDTLAGRDVLGRGRTGSGKTIAFACRWWPGSPSAKPSTPQARPPAAWSWRPTRELATQIDAAIEPLAKAIGLNTTVIFGGVAQARQVKALRGGVDIVIACPGRLEDLIRQRILTLDAVEITVLDEADHMADLGFLPGVTQLLDTTPRQGQRMLFSATLDNGVDVLVKRYLTNPVTHSVDDPQAAVDHDDAPRAGASTTRPPRSSCSSSSPPAPAAACSSPAPSTAPGSWPSR